MKHFKFILPIIFILFSCTTDSVQEPENTQLELTIKDENDMPLENVVVKLFATEDDLFNDENIVQTLNTNANGKVLFNELQSIKYYWRTNIECYSVNLIDNSTNALTSNTLNQFTLNLAENFIGDITVQNTSPYEQSVVITGPNNYSFNILAGGSVSLTGCPTGSYTCVNTPIASPNPIPITLTFELYCNGHNLISF